MKSHRITISDKAYEYLDGMIEDALIFNVDMSEEKNENEETIAHRPTFSEVVEHLIEDREDKSRIDVRSSLAVLQEVLKKFEAMQPEAVEIIRKHGFIFKTNLIRKHGFIFKTNLPKVVEHPPGEKSSEEWEKLAFSLYSDLCQINSECKQLRKEGLM